MKKILINQQEKISVIGKEKKHNAKKNLFGEKIQNKNLAGKEKKCQNEIAGKRKK